jgi:predicted Zn-dependent protease
LAAYAVGDCAEAIRHCRTAIELRPDAVLGHWVLGASLTAVGSPGLGIDALTMATSIAGETDHLLAVLASAHSAAGHIDQARALVERLERKAVGAWVSLPWRALGACALGDVERAMDLLEQAAAEHAVGLNNLGLPAYDCLRGHPRFVALVRSVKLPPVVGAPRS